MKSWADSSGIRTGVLGEVLDCGITIAEKNRATGWEHRRAGIEVLQKICRESYRKKGVNALVFGVYDGPDVIKYAVFVQNGFLTEMDDE
jgi:hypothetical protein